MTMNRNYNNIEYKSSYINDFKNSNNITYIDKYYHNDKYEITNLSSDSRVSTFNFEFKVFENIDFNLFLQDDELGDFIIKCLMFIKESLYYLLKIGLEKTIPKLYYRKDLDGSDVFTWSYTNYRITLVFDVNDSFCSIAYLNDDEFVSKTKQLNLSNYKKVLIEIMNLVLYL